MAAAVAVLSIVVKNTFLSVEDDEEEERRRCCSQRSTSVPPRARLATGPAATTPKAETELSISDVSTEVSDGDAAPGDETNSSSSSVCSVEQLSQRTPLNARANLYKPRQPPYVSLPLPPGPLPPNADWSWSNNPRPPEKAHVVGPTATPEAAPIAIYEKPARRFRHLCFKTAAAVREALEDYVHDVKIVEGNNHWSVVANVLPESLGHEEKLRTLSKDAVIGATRSIGKMCVLGYRRRPFTNTPFGFTASLAPVPNKDHACWGAFARGCCTNGDACRWEHPTCASTLSVIIRTPCSE